MKVKNIWNERLNRSNFIIAVPSSTNSISTFTALELGYPEFYCSTITIFKLPNSTWTKLGYLFNNCKVYPKLVFPSMKLRKAFSLSAKMNPSISQQNHVNKTKYIKMSSSPEGTNSSDGTGTFTRAVRSSTAPPLDRQQLLKMHRKPSSVRSRSSGGSSLGSSASQKPMTVTYKSVTTSGKLFSKKTTSVDCGAFVKDSG